MKVKVKWFDHRIGAQWLTMEICEEYRKKALELPSGSGDIGAWRDLRKELQELCDITELQALNILNGRYCQDYVEFYNKMRANEELWYKMVDKDDIYH